VNISRHQDRPIAPPEPFGSQPSPAAKQPTRSRAADRYAAIHQSFGWKVPKRFNMAQACCGQWAAQAATAKRQAVREHVAGQGPGRSWTFGQLQQDANRLSRVLRSHGVQRGDRVAIVMPQRYETAVAYMAVLQMGAVAMPLSMLFGPEALSFRINDSQACVAVCDESTVQALLQARADCPGLQTLLGVGEAGTLADLDLNQAMAASASTFKPVSTWARRPGGADLHQRHHRQPQGCAHPSPGNDR
jgi:acetyl-CoA synthetase